jgi:hypothetical protein
MVWNWSSKIIWALCVHTKWCISSAETAVTLTYNADNFSVFFFKVFSWLVGSKNVIFIGWTMNYGNSFQIVKFRFWHSVDNWFETRSAFWLYAGIKIFLTLYNTTQDVFFRELNSTIEFELLITTVYLDFSQHVRFLRYPSMILPKTLKIP